MYMLTDFGIGEAKLEVILFRGSDSACSSR